MILNAFEFMMMNNPVRAFCQRQFEARRLLNMGGAVPGGRALEIGCGRGVGARIVLDRFGAASVDAFDLDPRMVRRAVKRLEAHGKAVHLWVGDATFIAAGDATYDAVFDFGIIHHIPDWRKALHEIARVLKPGGRFFAEEILQAFILHPLWRGLLDHPQEDRFDHATFVRGIEDAGLSVEGTRCLGRSIGWYFARKAQYPS